MSETGIDAPRRILAFSAAVEIGTGLTLMFDPALVVSVLLGMDASGAARPLGRCFGIALLALGSACWPSGQSVRSRSPAVRAMGTYNLLIALYLSGLGTVGRLGGPLLWPAVALHAGVALFLAWTWWNERRATGPRNPPGTAGI